MNAGMRMGHMSASWAVRATTRMVTFFRAWVDAESPVVALWPQAMAARAGVVAARVARRRRRVWVAGAVWVSGAMYSVSLPGCGGNASWPLGRGQGQRQGQRQ